MKRFCIIAIVCVLLVVFTACASIRHVLTSLETGSAETEAEQSQTVESVENKQDGETGQYTIRISANGTVLTGVLEDNATTRALITRMPMTLSMEDLYDRELCYHFGAGTFPIDQMRSDAYEVGDIIYWPPSGSFVILYRQNGELFSRQHLGHIESDVALFETTGDTAVTFEVLLDE